MLGRWEVRMDQAIQETIRNKSTAQFRCIVCKLG